MNDYKVLSSFYECFHPSTAAALTNLTALSRQVLERKDTSLGDGRETLRHCACSWVGWASRPPVSASCRNYLWKVRDRETRSPADRMPTLPEPYRDAGTRPETHHSNSARKIASGGAVPTPRLAARPIAIVRIGTEMAVINTGASEGT
jgi:hypothetical protein